jgi:hypothetical protein
MYAVGHFVVSEWPTYMSLASRFPAMFTLISLDLILLIFSSVLPYAPQAQGSSDVASM